MRIQANRFFSLVIALVLLAGLLPALGMTARAEGEIPEIDFNAEGEISVVTIYHPYTEVGDRVSLTYPAAGLGCPSGVISARSASNSGRGLDLIEKDTGRIVPIISGNEEERFDYKRYTLRIYLQGDLYQVDGSYRYRSFADDARLYLKQHVDSGVTDNYMYLPASHFYSIDEEGYTICAEFELDFSYFGAFQLVKRMIGKDGSPADVGFNVAWYNKDDVMSDGTASYDPDTGTLRLKGDVEKLWLTRWMDSEPPRIRADADVNVELLSLNASGCDRAVLCGPGTLNVGTLHTGLSTSLLVLSACSATFREWDADTRVELENTKLSSPAGAMLDYRGRIVDAYGNQVSGGVRFQPAFTTLTDSGDVGSIHWSYDFTTATFTVSGSGRFERLEPYDKYLDVMETFRTEAGVTELGDDLVRDSSRLRKVFLANTIRRIGRNNFSGCKHLTEANLPNGLRYILSGCFSGSGLKTVSLPRTLLSIDDGCFSRMSALETVSFPYYGEQSWLVIGDDCFAHLPQAKELRFGDGPWIVGSGSFCDMPELTKVRMGTAADELVDNKYRIYLGNSLYYLGDYSFSDLPRANYLPYGRTLGDAFPTCYQYYHLPYTLMSVGRGSLGYAKGAPTAVAVDSDFAPGGQSRPLAIRYAWANGLPTEMDLAIRNKLPSEESIMGNVSYEDSWYVVTEADVRALTDYLNLPLKLYAPGTSEVLMRGRTLESDVDFSGKVDHKDLILLKRRAAGWPGLEQYFDRDYLWEAKYGAGADPDDYLAVWRGACEDNFTAATGLELSVGSVELEYEDRALVYVPVRSTYNAGYIGGSVTVKWNAEAMDLVGVLYNDALAPENGSGLIDNELSYPLTESLTLDGAGEYVIRFGDDFAAENITGTGELFTLVFRLWYGAEPDAFTPARSLDFDVRLKDFDIYDADLHFVRTELTEAGAITTTLGSETIRELSVVGVATPLAGQRPSYTAAVSAGAPYQVSGLSWLYGEPDEEGYYSLVQPYETFEPGRTYRAVVSLAPSSSAFRFADAEEMRGTINGKWNAEVWVNEAHDASSLSYTFTCAEGTPATGLILNKTEAALTVGDSASLQVVTLIPYEAADLGVFWSSSDGSVAAVDANGRVTALRAGSAVVTATSGNGGVQASCVVTVEKRRNTLRTLVVTGVTAPLPGEQPASSAAVPPAASYRLSYSSLAGGSVAWLQKTGENASTLLNAGDRFEDGETYLVWVYVEPVDTATDTYRFPAKAEMEATLNGLRAQVQWVNDDGTQACVQYAFPCRGISLTGTKSGGHVSYTVSAPAALNALLVGASYDQKGKLLGMKTEPLSLGAGGETSGAMNLPQGETVKLMLLSSATHAPLTAAWTG